MKLDRALDGWWIIEPDAPARQLRTGDEYDICLVRGPFATREIAEDARWHDSLPGYFEHDLVVYARHCNGCGWWAKTLAFDDTGLPNFTWSVTECQRCGIVDSRVKRCSDLTKYPKGWLRCTLDEGHVTSLRAIDRMHNIDFNNPGEVPS
jgi:hypothetical protein